MLHYIAEDNTLFNLKNKACKIEKNHEFEKLKKNIWFQANASIYLYLI
jgi:hypothetical protein